MLFDLRGRGKRRTIQTIYLGLAVLMALGLVGFGIGSNINGGIAEVFTKKEGSSAASYSAQVTKAREQIKKNPQDASAWEALTEAQLHEASASGFYDQATETYTEAGKEELHKAARSWSHYLTLNPSKPNPSLALQMAAQFASPVLNEPDQAVQAIQITIAAEPPTAHNYSALAEYAYLAHNVREGDLASKKAVSLAPKERRPLMEAEFERMKESAKESEAGTATGTGEAGGGGASTGGASTGESAGG